MCGVAVFQEFTALALRLRDLLLLRGLLAGPPAVERLFGAPDIIFEPRLEANLVYKLDLTDAITVKAKVDNLLNSEVEYTQGGQPYQIYEKGTKFSVSVDWDL